MRKRTAALAVAFGSRGALWLGSMRNKRHARWQIVRSNWRRRSALPDRPGWDGKRMETRDRYLEHPHLESRAAAFLFCTQPGQRDLPIRLRSAHRRFKTSGISFGESPAVCPTVRVSIAMAISGTAVTRPVHPASSPDSRIDSVIDLPVTNVTNCAFDGADYRTLYVTTGRRPDSATGDSQCYRFERRHARDRCENRYGRERQSRFAGAERRPHRRHSEYEKDRHGFPQGQAGGGGSLISRREPERHQR